MRIIGHLLYISIFISIFLVGKLMVMWNRRWAYAMSHNPATAQDVSKFFLYGGRTFEIFGVVATGVDVVAILVLCSEYLVDFAVGS